MKKLNRNRKYEEPRETKLTQRRDIIRQLDGYSTANISIRNGELFQFGVETDFCRYGTPYTGILYR
jgi:hypothetical protein